MKWRWIAGGGLLAGAALAASWGLGLWDGPPPTEAAAPPDARAAGSRAVAPAPLQTVAWMLANSRAKPAPAQRAGSQDDGSSCGATGAPCADDAVCLDGGCVGTVCEPDAGPGDRCALPSGGIGACCGERCVDLEADGVNCGRCGAGCQSGLDCVSGECEARSCVGRMAGTPCDEVGHGGRACCRSACVDRSNWTDDSANCGGCGHACAPGLTCKQGSCVDAATGARPSWTCLEEGHGCPAGTFCVLDACFPRSCNGDNDGLLCPGPSAGELGHCCGQLCADLYGDSDNCRACGVRCAPGQLCRSGDCVAP